MLWMINDKIVVSSYTNQTFDKIKVDIIVEDIIQIFKNILAKQTVFTTSGDVVKTGDFTCYNIDN